MRDHPLSPAGNPTSDLPDRCRQCRGCIECGEVHCLFHAQGNPEDCSTDRCKYCVDFMQKDRLYMNNVG